MTVHAAKGLEFPVVILADITAKLARQDPDMYVDAKANLCAMRLVGCSPWDLLDHEKEERERDLAEAVRVSYVAATRARDLLVVPAVGDGPYEGWLNPLNLAIYPPPERRRQAENSPRCPAFGSDSVVERPFECDEPPQSSVMPGLHRPQLGSHTVTWWDPAKLPKPQTTNFGIRQQEILSREPGGEAVSESMLLYQDWQRHRALVLEKGKRPQFNLSVVTEAPELPESFEATIDLETVERSGERPQGARFGSLVHAVLGDADLSGTAERLAALAQVHGRVLGSSAEEIAAAIEAARAALTHPLLARARHAERCHREIPVLVKCLDGRMIEGTLDLAFLEEGTWNIVDFKTDAHLPRFKPQYVRQLQWYVYAMGRVTGAPACGWLLSV